MGRALLDVRMNERHLFLGRHPSVLARAIRSRLMGAVWQVTANGRIRSVGRAHTSL